MKKLLLFLNLGIILNSPTFADTLPIAQFGGLDTDNSELVLPNGRTPDGQNVNTDESQGISPRLGFTIFSTESSRNLWAFSPSNGTKFIITQSSGLLKANSGTGTFAVGIATVDPNVTTVGSQLGDSFFFTNITDGLKSYDGNTVSVASAPMKFTQLATWKGRLWGSGMSGKERVVWGSRFNDGTFWSLVTNPADTDPTQITVSGGLDEVITTLYASFKDMLIWAKANSFGSIAGSRRSNFTQRTISDSVGTAYPDTMRDCDGELRFLGSRRIIWGYDGATLNDLTRYKEGGGIRTLMGTLVQGDANSKLWQQSSQSDWNQGISGVRVQTDVSPGDVVFVSTSFSEGFDNGSCSALAGNTLTCAPRWTVQAGRLSVAAGLVNDGGGGGAGYAVSHVAIGTWTLTSSFINGDPNNFALYFIVVTTQASTPFVQNGYSLQWVSSQWRVNQLPTASVLISSTPGSLATTNVKVTRNTNGVFQLLINDALAGTATDTSFSTCNLIGIDFQNCINCGINQIDLTENIFHSSFTSQSFNIGNKITSWGVFNANDNPNAGTIRYVLYASTQSNIDVTSKATFQASQTVTSNSIPTISTAPFVLVFSSFDRTDGSQQPTIHDFSVAWTEGTNLRAASVYTNQRWQLSVGVSTTSNNTILSFDRRREWNIYKGINADVMTTYQSNPYFGNSGGIYQSETGHSDNGATIDAYFVTRSFMPSGPSYVSTFKSLFMTTVNSAATLLTTYKADGVNTEYSLASRQMNFVGGYQNFSLPFTDNSLSKGRAISFKWRATTDQDWRIIGGLFSYAPEKTVKAN